MTFWNIVYSILLKPLVILFEVIYSFAYKLIGNPGLSIIALSLVMNFLVLPLYKRADAMQEEEKNTEAKLQKGVSHIKKTFKGDEKMMILQTYYRQNDYKPTYVLRGAISLLLEIPFFIAAYRFLSTLELLNGVSFGPISDLGKADGLIKTAGLSVNALPIIMTGVNLISCVIFTKGSTLKNKIQLYGMAIFFLFFLYTSPSGLVFYWTLNNVFSLIKTIFYKIKNPGKVLCFCSAVIGSVLFIIGCIIPVSYSKNIRVFSIVFGLALILPLIYSSVKKKVKFLNMNIEKNNNTKFFVSGCIFLSLFTGAYIPSTVIKSSAQEFVNIQYYSSPIWFLVSSFCIAFGAFVVWFMVFYLLAKKTTRRIFDFSIWIICGVSVVNFLFFGKNLGNLTSTLKYEKGLMFTSKELWLNLVVVVVVICFLSLLFYFLKKHLAAVLLIFCLTAVVMIPLSIVEINKQVESIKISDETLSMPKITLSKNQKNVVVLMIDRAPNSMLPFILNEKPELKEKFDGFTYYTNTVSFGRVTNIASPALLGGYEYTPDKLNERENESLSEKQNEALLVMPKVFSEKGYSVTIFDPIYANYQWISDLSLYSGMNNVDAYISMGKFSSVESYNSWYSGNMRNFFCFGLMKSVPLMFQRYFYNSGAYNSSKSNNESSSTSQIITGLHTANGLFSAFMDSYNVLDNLSNITNIVDSDNGTYLFVDNNTAHEPVLLDEQTYTPKEVVDNTIYDEEHIDRFSVDGKTLTVETEYQMENYQINLVAYLKLGEWFDYLREVGVYDNTKIIVCSDHGNGLFMDSQRILYDNDTVTDTEAFYPVLLVKDFNSKGFVSSDEFMTNADIAYLSTKDVIENAKNPYSGKALHDEDAKNNTLYISSSLIWSISENNGNQFVASDWYSLVNKDSNNMQNWSLVSRETVSPEK